MEPTTIESMTIEPNAIESTGMKLTVIEPMTIESRIPNLSIYIQYKLKQIKLNSLLTYEEKQKGYGSFLTK